MASVEAMASTEPAPRRAERAEELAALAEQAAARSDFAAAEAAAAGALELVPDLWKALAVMGFAQRRLGRPERAESYLRQALAIFPDDDWTLRELGGSLVDRGRIDEALKLMPQPGDDDAEGWFERAVLADQNSDAAAAISAARRTLSLKPRHLGARFQLARAQTARGEIREAADEYRRLTRVPEAAARAWFALLDLKTEKLSARELQALERSTAQARTSEDQQLLAFALGQAYEAAGKPAAAVAAFERGNQRRRRELTWDAERFTETVERSRAMFPEALRSTEQRGSEVIFLVGMPRSGTTLVEQILAAHTQVVAASELPEVGQIIAAESERRGKPYPDWVVEAREPDWARMGEEYLVRTSRWQTRQRFTDKMPENWLYVGPLIRMLPGAKFLGLERDPLETAWSCYKQLFSSRHCAWSYDYESLAAYSRDQRTLWRHFAASESARCRTVSYEQLVADFEAEVPRLLAFLGLEYQPACLDFSSVQRETRTASAAQVRRPLDRSTARRQLYGVAIEPLARALDRAGIGSPFREAQ